MKILSSLSAFACAALISTTALSQTVDVNQRYGVALQPNNKLSSTPPTIASDTIPIGISPDYSKLMLEQRREPVGKQRTMLQARQTGMLEPNQLIISGSAAGFLAAEHSNTDGKFGILSRFPSQHDSDKTGTDAITEYARLAGTLTLGEWVTAYGMLQYDELAYRGESDIAMDKAFVTIGNLDKFPLYAFYGRKVIDFGHFGTYNPFTETTNSHGFRAESDRPVYGLGYYDGKAEFVATAFEGGRQIRVADRGNDNDIGNFALNGSYRFDLGGEPGFGKDDFLRIGGGYLYATIYRNDFTNHTRSQLVGAPITVNERNGAWDVNAEMAWNNWMFMGEVTATERDWPATQHAVRSYTAQTLYQHEFLNRPSEVSLVLSRSAFGKEDTEFETIDQHTLGYRWQGGDFWWLGAEYTYNRGFVPLINVTRTSDSDVETHTALIGGRFWF